MEELPPLLEEEVEVVRAIYGEECVRVGQPGAAADTILALQVDLRPRVESGADHASLTLVVELPDGYRSPESKPPRAIVERSRGLGDAALRGLLSVAAQSAEEHCHEEMGCVCQILADVSDALDAANDSSECNICMDACAPGQAVVRTSCQHIFHAACIGQWSELKAAEAEALASEAERSARAELDGLRRDVAETDARQIQADGRVETAQVCVQRASRRVEVFRGQHTDEDEVSGPDDGAGEEEENEEDEVTLEVLKARLTDAKAELQAAQAETRKVRSRSEELRRRVEDMDGELAVAAAARAAASLPCPVCRVPIERQLLPASQPHPSRRRQPAAPSQAAVASLPPDLLAQVRKVQRDHEAILTSRHQKEQQNAQEESVQAPPASTEARDATSTASAQEGWSTEAQEWWSCAYAQEGWWAESQIATSRTYAQEWWSCGYAQDGWWTGSQNAASTAYAHERWSSGYALDQGKAARDAQRGRDRGTIESTKSGAKAAKDTSRGKGMATNDTAKSKGKGVVEAAVMDEEGYCDTAEHAASACPSKSSGRRWGARYNR